VHGRLGGFDDIPRHTNELAGKEPPGEPRKRAWQPPPPGTRANEQSGDAQLRPGLALQLEIVHLAAAAPLTVYELVVEHAVGEVELAGSAHPWPMFVSSINGIAVRETTKITRR